MPSWRDTLRDCTFRGIACHYRRASTQRGRRLVVHEYPHRDDADVEDLGRRNRKFRLDLFLLDSQAPGTLNARRDELINALEKPGPGTLVHPFYGSVAVYVERFRDAYSTREGGLVRVSATFVEAAAERAPNAATDTRVQLRNATDALALAAKADFVLHFITQDWPEYVRTSARNAIEAALGVLGIDAATVLHVLADIADVVALADGLFGGRDYLREAGWPAIRDVRDFGVTLPTHRTDVPSGRQQNRNRQAVIDTVQLIMISSALDVIANTEFASYDDAIVLRDTVLTEIDDALLTATDAVYRTLITARDALVIDIVERAGPLAHLRDYTTRQTLPAMVLAWTLYADAERGADIVRRNNVPNPDFIPGGERLEVLDG